MASKTSHEATTNGIQHDPLEQQIQVAHGLRNLLDTLSKDLNFQESAPQLSHYRTIPQSVSESYNMLQQGASLVHATSTKYTLLGKVDEREQTKIASDLLQGCQCVGTGCLAIHDNLTGCSRSARYHTRQAARAIVASVLQLVQSFLDHTAQHKDSQIGAQKTGAVWEACNMILEKKLPIGNRNAMRRDLLTYRMECNETLSEFQELLDRGPALAEEEEQAGKSKDDQEDDGNDLWDDFLEGQDDQYTTTELPVATACTALIKCSRGTINASLQAIEAVGEQIHQNVDEMDESDNAKLSWISRLHDLATAVGTGITDLGSTLYPPLNLDNVQQETDRQAERIKSAIGFIVDATTTQGECLDLPQETSDMASKLNDAVERRRTEVTDAIVATPK